MKTFLRLLLAASVLYSFPGCETKRDSNETEDHEESANSPDPNDTEDLQKIMSKAVEFKSLQERGDSDPKLFYQVNSQAPYSGWAKSMHPNGQVESVVNFQDGKREGSWVGWYENGQKALDVKYKNGNPELLTTWHMNGKRKSEINMKNGVQEGLATTWHENGQKESEENYENGEQKGIMTTWYENGTKETETNFIDGKMDVLVTSWHENGRKQNQANFKNGKMEGLVTTWYENGQKQSETNYESGERGKTTFWSEDGTKDPD